MNILKILAQFIWDWIFWIGIVFLPGIIVDHFTEFYTFGQCVYFGWLLEIALAIVIWIGYIVWEKVL